MSICTIVQLVLFSFLLGVLMCDMTNTLPYKMRGEQKGYVFICSIK